MHKHRRPLCNVARDDAYISSVKVTQSHSTDIMYTLTHAQYLFERNNATLGDFSADRTEPSHREKSPPCSPTYPKNQNLILAKAYTPICHNGKTRQSGGRVVKQIYLELECLQNGNSQSHSHATKLNDKVQPHTNAI